MSSISLKTDLHPSSYSCQDLSKSWFDFSESTSFIIITSFSYMHHTRMLFQIVFSSMFKPHFPADILGSSITFSWSRLVFSCVRFISYDLSDLCSDLNLILQSCTFYYFFSNCRFSWRNSIPKALFKELPNHFKAYSP